MSTEQEALRIVGIDAINAELRKLVAEREADRAAMRRALEALNYIVGTSTAMTPQQEHCWPVMRSAITDLRQRLEGTT